MTRIFARITRLLALPALLVLGLVAAPAVSAGDPCYHGFERLERTTEAAVEIKVATCAFAPTVARVPTGSTVTFFNGEFVHLITGANQEWGSRDVEVQPHTTVSYRFDEPGIYPYACALHPGMSGVIVVGDVTAALAAGSGTAEGDGSAGAAPAAAEPGTAGADAATGTGATGSGSNLPGPILLAAAGAGLAAGAGVVWLTFRHRGTTPGRLPTA
jgi:plastocyanin